MKITCSQCGTSPRILCCISAHSPEFVILILLFLKIWCNLLVHRCALSFVQTFVIVRWFFFFVYCYIVINGIIVNIDCSPVCTHPHTQLYRQLLFLFLCCCSCPFLFVYCYCYWWINCQHWLLTVVHSSSYTVVQTGAAAAPYPWVLNSFFSSIFKNIILSVILQE